MKFILSRTDDIATHSKKWIAGYGLHFWLLSRILATGLIIGCVAVYAAFGINPETLTRFAGSPEVAGSLGAQAYVLLTLLIVAPLLEECIFRLGLSFKKWQVALSAASIPAYILWQYLSRLTLFSTLIFLLAIAGAFILVNRFTKEALWTKQKRDHYQTYVWCSAIAFGIVHLIAFTSHSLILIPYMLCVVSVPFLAGCAITYYRVNLGFWWGVGLHIFNNLPAVIVMSLIQT